jgi:general secretion pathway protein J
MMTGTRTKSLRARTVASAGAFTMIEVVIAITILAIIMGVTYSALTGIIKTKKLLDDGRDSRLIANSLLNRFSRELQLASAGTTLMPAREDSKGKQISRISLLGAPNKLDNGQEGDRITFMALEGGQYLPDGGTHSGIVQITYRVEKDPDAPLGNNETYYLVREETPYYRPFEKAYEKTMIFPVTHDLVSLKLQYFSTEAGEWQNDWGEEASARLPSMVRFRFQLRTPLGKIETYAATVALRSLN